MNQNPSAIILLFHRKEKNVIYCLWVEWQIFPFADGVNKLPEGKHGSVCVFRYPAMGRKYFEAKRMFIFPHGTWKDNIRSVIWDWRQRSAGRSSEGERSAVLSSEWRDSLVTQANLSAPPCVFSGYRTTSQKGSPPQKKDMCELSLTVFLLHTNVAVDE